MPNPVNEYDKVSRLAAELQAASSDLLKTASLLRLGNVQGEALTAGQITNLRRSLKASLASIKASVRAIDLEIPDVA